MARYKPAGVEIFPFLPRPVAIALLLFLAYSTSAQQAVYSIIGSIGTYLKYPFVEWPFTTVVACLFLLCLGAVLFVIRVNLKLGGLIRDPAQGPLQGVVVLDLSVVVAGSMAASMLAEMGAEVVKLDSLKLADSTREQGNAPSRGMSSTFMQVGRGKQGISVDTRTNQGLEVLRRLAEKADVVIQVLIECLLRAHGWLCQNFSPGGAESAGLGYAQCKEWNPHVIFCSSCGFGTGPYKDRGLSEPLLQALSGSTVIQGSEHAPRMAPGLHFEKFQAMMCCEAILAALVARERGAGGQYLEVSMLASALQMLWPDCYAEQTWVDTATSGAAFIFSWMP